MESENYWNHKSLRTSENKYSDALSKIPEFWKGNESYVNVTNLNLFLYLNLKIEKKKHFFELLKCIFILCENQKIAELLRDITAIAITVSPLAWWPVEVLWSFYISWRRHMLLLAKRGVDFLLKIFLLWHDPIPEVVFHSLILELLIWKRKRCLRVMYSFTSWSGLLSRVNLQCVRQSNLCYCYSG